MANIYKLKFTILQQGIVRFLSAKAGKSFNALRLAKSLEVSQAAIAKALPKLEEEELIKTEKDKESGRWSVELNRDSRKVLQMKRIENLRVIYESGLFDFLEKEFAGSTIILFGSYSKGEDVVGSDIDIAVIGRKEKKIDLGEFEKKLDREIFVNFYDSFKGIHKRLKENIFNGVVLVGGIEV
ncbi:MAG: nucleotidyltransferase domain-containing protein [Nanoarchaeota archaeon]|nr:nucleotidyltransferase domain-containing protein [Nanoarchaeota archaeon]MBU1103654.1 nucleotidyltransferase domain-containing protein [Nanoarchaeota archaeon]